MLCSTGNDKWSPERQAKGAKETTLDYFYKLEAQQAKLTGAYYREMACFNNIDACGAGIYFYGVHEADPVLTIKSDGYLGLGLAEKGSIDEKYNTLN
jgi:hypothetical protein